MLDRIHMFVPFKKSEVIAFGNDIAFGKKSAEVVKYTIKASLLDLGVRPVGEVYKDPKTGQIKADNLRTPWESLPTSFTGLAVKVYPNSCGTRHMPGIELKASPAKLLQGHNVFGPTSIENGGLVMLKWVAGTYPDLYERLDLENAEVMSMDCTYSARLPDERTALQAIQAIRGVSNGQTKCRGDDYETTAYFGAKDSRLRKLKVYLKHPEYLRQLEEAKSKSGPGYKRTVEVLSDQKLAAWAKCLLRMEVTVTKRWLERRGISANWKDLCAYQTECKTAGNCLIQWCWEQVTQELFSAFEGQTMRVIKDESVLKALKATHFRQSKSGDISYSYALSLFRTYRSLKDYGWEETQNSMPKATFNRHIREITQCGISKAALQKLKQSDQTNNVVPILRFMAVDFGAQRPSWYVEPRVEAA